MVVYTDSSFLFSLYAQDANTSRAAELAAAFTGALLFTPLQRFELRNALRLSVFRGDIAEGEYRRLLEQIEADTKTGVLAETPVSWAEVFAEAEALSAAHTGKTGTRALDVLHIASAAALGAKTFYTFDARQKTLAAKAGMRVKP
ncbi:MAG: type II toxin-antitoxin system VapC family toxin [Kiritimatiellae bacterium]|jgi:predicted nucleic acid-binding protein|nr:type II toxin-antitoxin system VapC family toxin [Kiritimatiellia bacterium]